MPLLVVAGIPVASCLCERIMDTPSQNLLKQPPGEGETALSVIVAVHEHSDALLPFVHALCLATAAEGELEIVDVRKGHPDRSDLGVRRTFEHWRMLPAGSQRHDVENLGLKVKKIVKPGHARHEIAKRLAKHPHDILVIGTEARVGIAHLFGLDLAEYLANSQRQTTLYVPKNAKPFANPETGEVTLNKIVVPVAEDPAAEPSFDLVRRLQSFLPDQPMEVVGIHAGDIFPYVSPSALEGLSYRETMVDAEDSVAHAIALAAFQEKADLIVMSTNGRDTISQRIMGSVTEQVLRKAPCPVLAVAAA